MKIKIDLLGIKQLTTESKNMIQYTKQQKEKGKEAWKTKRGEKKEETEGKKKRNKSRSRQAMERDKCGTRFQK